jgi:uncharacterized protein (TIGR00251 family)
LAESCRIRVRVRPGAPKDLVLGMKGEDLAVSIKAPPVDGKANESLVRFLAGSMGLKARDVSVVTGLSSRSKTVRVEGLPESEAMSRLLGNQAGGTSGTECGAAPQGVDGRADGGAFPGRGGDGREAGETFSRAVGGGTGTAVVPVGGRRTQRGTGKGKGGRPVR